MCRLIFKFRNGSKFFISKLSGVRTVSAADVFRRLKSHNQIIWIHLLINKISCSSDPPYVDIDDVSVDDFRNLMDLNVTSYFLVAKVRLYVELPAH